MKNTKGVFLNTVEEIVVFYFNDPRMDKDSIFTLVKESGKTYLDRRGLIKAKETLNGFSKDIVLTPTGLTEYLTAVGVESVHLYDVFDGSFSFDPFIKLKENAG